MGLPTTAPKVISREAGSGTRKFFEQAILQSKRNYHADQYVGSNQLMLDTVSKTKNSIGYLSFEYAAKILTTTLRDKVHVGAVTFNDQTYLP